MLKREKSAIIIFLIEISIPLFFFVGIPLGIFILATHEDSGKVIRESYWGIALPTSTEMDKVLKERTETGPHGECMRHSIYVVERSGINFKFRIDAEDDIETKCREYCETVGTAAEYVPDFSKEYRWRKFEKEQDTLILVYFAETKQLHIFEEFF